jgi:hypothetical protein
MQRTQIYFEEVMLEELKQKAKSLNLSLSAYIRDVLKNDLEQDNRSNKKLDLSEFAGMWKDRKISLEDIRESAWK